MYEVYRKKDDGVVQVIPFAGGTKAQAILDAGRINAISNGGWKVRRIKPDYIYVIKRNGKYWTTVKTRQLARDYVSLVKGNGVNVNKKYTITQINLNNCQGKTVR
ncbi:hypothetical protein TY_30 [Pseudomonas phage vB_PaeM_Ty]|nr:hypothetical protein TY_30 [Pseudomonas phage vB_PaeM_Ty]